MPLSELVNRRVDEELEGYSRAFERLAALRLQEEKDEAERKTNRKHRAA